MRQLDAGAAQQVVLCSRRGAAQVVEVDGDAPPVADHWPAPDEHVARVAPVAAPHELQGDVAVGRQRRRPAVEHHHVGQLAGRQRTDLGALADGLGSPDRGQLESVVRAEPFRVDRHVPRQPRRQRRHPQHVGQVAGVACVASQRQAATPARQLQVPPRRRDTLAQPQVRPRAVGDGGLAGEKQLHLGVVQPHAVGQQQVAPQDPQAIEVHDGTGAAVAQVALGVGGGGRDVHGHAAAGVACQVSRPRQQFVGGQVVAYERDPSLDEPSGGMGLQHGALAVQHLLRGGRERGVARVPTPGPHGAAHPDGRHSRSDPVGMGHRAGLHQRGDAAESALRRGQRGREFVVVTAVLGMQRYGPREDRLARGHEVRDAAAHQRIAGAVLVGVDESWRHDATRGVHLVRARVGRPQSRRRAHRSDAVPGDGHRAPHQHLPPVVHRHHVTAENQQHARLGRRSRPLDHPRGG